MLSCRILVLSSADLVWHAAAIPNCDCRLSAIPLQKDQGPPTSKHSPDVGAQL